MQRNANWEEQQKLIADAKVLARFANLTSDGVELFCRDNPDFFPVSWWDYRPTTLDKKPSPKMQWEIVQDHVRDAWLFEFQLPLLHSMFLVTAVFDPEEMGWDENGHHPPFLTGTDIFELEAYPYHDVIQWLPGQSWRVKRCKYEKCGKYFIAEHPKRLFCTNDGDSSCFWAYRKAYQQKHWEDHSDSVNEHRRQEYKETKYRIRRKSVKKSTAR